MSDMLSGLINESNGKKSLSGKVAIAEHSEFLRLCEHLGLSKSTVSSAILRAGLNELRAEAAKRPAVVKKVSKKAAKAAEGIF